MLGEVDTFGKCKKYKIQGHASKRKRNVKWENILDFTDVRQNLETQELKESLRHYRSEDKDNLWVWNTAVVNGCWSPGSNSAVDIFRRVANNKRAVGKEWLIKHSKKYKKLNLHTKWTH